MTATDLNINEINAAKSQPMYLRSVADDYASTGCDATASDYRIAADTIERLLSALGIPAFTA